MNFIINHTIKYIAITVLSVVLTSSCTKNNITPENIFTRIYSDQNSDLSFYPLDLMESQAGGYYILGATTIDTTRTWLNTYILKVDAVGALLWDSIIPPPYMNPVSNLLTSGSDNYFFCMDQITLGTHLLKISEGNQSVELVATFANIIYPLAASQTPDNGYLLLSYDRTTRNSSLTHISPTNDIIWQTKFPVVEDAEEMLIEHLTRTGRILPFFTGSVGNGSASHYYANGLYNYSLSFLFVNAGSGAITGISNGFRYDGGVASASSIQSNNFALSRFSFGDHFFLPSITIDMNAITSVSDLGGNPMAEVEPEAETRQKKIRIDDKDIMVFASSTNNNQAILNFYDETTGSLLNTKYLGFYNPVKIASVIQTSDEGLAILMQTMVTGRFKRISLHKLPKSHLLE